MRNRCLAIVILLLLALAGVGLGLSLVLAPLPEPLAAILYTPTPTATHTPTPTPTSTPTPTATPTPTPEPLSITLLSHPSRPPQGSTLVIQIRANREVTLTGTLANRPLEFVQLDGTYWALAGFTSWSPVGPHDVVVEARSDLGEVIQATDTVTVTYSAFPVEIIDIPSDREYLLDPAIVVAERKRLDAIYAEFRPDKVWQGVFGYPVQAVTITSAYGARRQYDTGPGYHAGVDLDGELGDAVFASADGHVALAEFLQVRGGTAIVDHGLGVYSCYAHMSEIFARPGESVSRGQVIGYMGSTGLSTGTHLHWELRVGGIAVDPFEWSRRRIIG